jgi:hypothetical protein
MLDIKNWASPCTGDYFAERARIIALRDSVSQLYPAAADIIRQLEIDMRKAGFEPVGAIERWGSIDGFLDLHPELRRQEEQLAEKIRPENVTEVLDLLQRTEHYKPSSRIMNAMSECLQKRLALNEPSMAQPDASMVMQSSFSQQLPESGRKLKPGKQAAQKILAESSQKP